jgi:hypothetical protein
MYYEDFAYDGPENPFEEENARIKEHGAEHLSAVYAMLSGSKKIDVRDLYWHLEEVASSLDYDIPYKPEHEDFLHSLIV